MGGHDRGIFQWRTCGVASGLPPLPVIYKLLKEANEKVRAGLVGMHQCIGLLARRCNQPPHLPAFAGHNCTHTHERAPRTSRLPYLA